MDLLGGLLTRQGLRVKLQDQSFRILAMLLEHPGEIIGREELRQELWPNGTYVDFEGSLNAALKRLRAALDDDPDKPRFIETVPKRGYRFIAPLESSGSAAPMSRGRESDSAAVIPFQSFLKLPAKVLPESTPKTLAEASTSSRRRPALWVSLALGIAALGAWQFVYWAFPLPPPAILRVTQITDDGLIDGWAGIRTDGARLFFLERHGGRWVLMQTSMNGGPVQRAAVPFEDANVRIMDVSPDRSTFLIGTFQRRDEESPMWLWPIQGGPPRRLGSISASTALWGPNAKWIFFTHDHRIFRISPDGTSEEEILHPHADEVYVVARSPDGKKIRFVTTSEPSSSQYLEANADGTGIRPVLVGWGKSVKGMYSSWVPSGRYFVAQAAQDGKWDLYAFREARSWFHRAPIQPTKLTRGGDDGFGVVEPSAEDSRVYSLRSWRIDELLQFDIHHHRITPATLDTTSGNVVFSPDDQWVVYFHSDFSMSRVSMWRSRPDGTDRLQLTQAPVAPLEPRFSPDGKRILFLDAQSGASRRLCVIRVEGGSVQVVPTPKNMDLDLADWTPDGQHIVATLEETSTGAKPGLWILDLKNGQMQPMEGGEGYVNGVWSPAGLMAATDAALRRVSVFDSRSKHWDAIAEGSLLGYLRWSLDGKSLYFQDLVREGEPVYRYDVRTRSLQVAAEFSNLLKERVARCGFMGIGPDDTLYIEVQHGKTDIFALDLNLP